MLLTIGVFAENSNLGTTGAAFLQIPVGARETGMAGAFSALTGDANAIFYNPAGLGKIVDETQFFLHHNSWIEDIGYDQIGFSQSLSAGGTVAMGLALLHYDRFDRIDNEGNIIGDFSANDMSVGLAWGNSLGNDFFYGAGLKYIHSEIEKSDADSVALDLGMIYWPSDDYLVSALVQNVGPSLKMEEDSVELPRSFRIGGAAYFMDDCVATALDISFNNYGPTEYRLGAEYSLWNMYFIRAGFVSADEDDFSAGAGFRLIDHQIDYSFTPKNSDLGDAHRISLLLRF
jgi:hypothetical protein